ncbi:MAG TPA: pyridoxine 5'-phosphate synthase [Kiritimatiellia bacterium]|nr:pyridoxine 5'-phosphate synthase [Kiritimatiellia bacterium]HNS80639.1 pyridoxine 5'-phosphate synthase [Kiritimatiellia bacterium]HPA77710.1 pyridoxine 5'-phosphate synthase [Kiritimatiellia bacterium]HQQ03805.1 pyridoxine 5'-phosphate synthase [Kiritimatiellia bacterium]
MKLGVNIDHVATIRQARGTRYPDIVEAAEACRRGGAHGITIHLREDRRHIQDADVFAVKKWGRLPLNLEMANAEEIVAIALKVKPEEVCLVPEKRRELTTEGGLDVVRDRKLKQTVARLSEAGVRVSLFVDPDPRQLEASLKVGATCVELHTGRYCDTRGTIRKRELRRLAAGAKLAHKLGLQVNAGHGLNLDNLDGLASVPHLDTLNIGHSIVARAVLIGLEPAVREMLRAMKGIQQHAGR